MARRSLEQWRELDARLDGRRAGDAVHHAEPLWHASGVLWMAAGTDAYTAATRDTLTRLGMPPDALGPADVRDRFPQFNTDGIQVTLLERECGVVAARRAVRALVAELEQRGVRTVSARIDAPETAGVRALRANDGTDIAGDRFVFACGAWLPRLFPEALRNRIRPTRQLVAYFGTPAGDSRYRAARLPAWIDFPAGMYGTPDIDGRGIKVGIDDHGGSIDPDADDRLPDASSVQRARDWLAHRVPALGGAPVVETRVCAYENTDTGDFIIDRHPAHGNVWIVGGGSGHGFKHGPAVGELAAQMILEGVQPDARFALVRRTTDARRAVY
jgi:glycine/D-amino acid oxidase-like deaminating enzyme